MKITSVNNIVLMQVVDGTENLLDSLRGVLLGEFALFANPIEQLSSSRKLGDDVIFILKAWPNMVSLPDALVLTPGTQYLPLTRTSP